MIPPGKTIGILGGGQLGRMLGQAAQSMGYRVQVFEPVGPCPAGAVANREVNASYDDLAALTAFARECAVVTYEFENIPSGPLDAIAPLVPLFPRAEVLHVTQNRQREKAWLRANGFPHVPYAEALDGDLAAVIGQVGRPCVVKTADFGYDGKGQMKIVSDADLEKAAAIFRGRRCVLERWVDFSCELSVIVARSSAGETKAGGGKYSHAPHPGFFHRSGPRDCARPARSGTVGRRHRGKTRRRRPARGGNVPRGQWRSARQRTRAAPA
jgi:5-(carboxyamino)imidazole ribonucleotide synthase